MKPQRIQRKRTKGWKMPENTISVTRPGKWGNPFAIADFPLSIDPVAAAVACFKMWLTESGQRQLVKEAREQLQGKNLACWCRPLSECHADVWLEIANVDRAPQPDAR